MTIKAIIKKIENENAIIITDNQEKIIWPKNKLPEKSKENDVVWLNIVNSCNEKNQFAQDVLNEVLTIKNE